MNFRFCGYFHRRSLYRASGGRTRHKYTLRKIDRRTEGPFKKGNTRDLPFLDTLRVLLILRSLYINLVRLTARYTHSMASGELKTMLRRVYSDRSMNFRFCGYFHRRSLYRASGGCTRYKYTLRKTDRRAEGPFKKGNIRDLPFLDTLRVLLILRSLYINLARLTARYTHSMAFRGTENHAAKGIKL